MCTRFSMRPLVTSRSHLSTVLITNQLDPFDVSVGRISQDDAAGSSLGRYLHPVVRHYRRGALLSEHHVTENLENEWTDPITHRDPLRVFLQHEMTTTRETGESVTA